MVTTRPRPGPGRPPKTSRGDVVAAAVALADEQGLEAVTMRAVAGRLGVAPMTLYGHVAGSDELADLVVEATIGAAVAAGPPLPTTGREALLAFAHGLRRMVLDHPAVLEAYRRRPVQGPTGSAVAGAVLSVLMADGLDEGAAVGAYAAVSAFVVGFASLEARPVDLDTAALEGDPTLHRLGPRLVHMYGSAAFDQGLAALVDAATPGGPR